LKTCDHLRFTSKAGVSVRHSVRARCRLFMCLGLLLAVPFCIHAAEEHRDTDEVCEAELQVLQRKLFEEALLQAIPVAVFFKDRDGRYLGCNDAFSEIMGVSCDEILGKTVFELWPGELAATYHKADLDLMANPVHQVYPFKVRDRHGVVRPVIYGKHVFRDVNGEVAGIVGAFVDLSEQRALQNRLLRRTYAFLAGTVFFCLALAVLLAWLVLSLRRQRQLMGESERERNRYAAVLKATYAGIWEWNLKTGEAILSERWAQLLGYTLVELAPVSTGIWKRLMHPDDLVISAEALEKHLRGDADIYRCEVRMQHKNGEWQWILVRGAVTTRDTQGKPLVMMGSIQNVSARRQAEEERERLQDQLAQAQKMESVGRLAGGVAHDFNNMLGAILGNAELALDEMPEDSTLREYLEEILTCAKRSADLTRQLLAFARRQTVMPKEIDLNAAMDGIVKMLHRLIGEEIELVWSPGSDRCPVLMDPSQLDQILANLCVNARDAIADVGQIWIETGCVSLSAAACRGHVVAQPGDYVTLVVRDNGCGMDAETMMHLFEPFFTTKEVGKGTGLGLATVFGAVKQNKGYIDVESTPGKGTAFTIYLPRHCASSSRVDSALPDAAQKHGHETILLVEDEQAMLKITRQMLEGMGYAVLAADLPHEAIRMAREYKGRIDLLVTDLVMPQMSGRDLAKAIQELHPGIKRLFMSGYAADKNLNQIILDKSVFFVQKPFSMKAFGAKIRETLEQP
jgi:two-component system, cell cycle sensor histidine kinase and response regulator CckA